MINFSCPGCGKKMQAADDLAGRSAKCKKCGGKLTIPSPHSNTSSDADGAVPKQQNPAEDAEGKQQQEQMQQELERVKRLKQEQELEQAKQQYEQAQQQLALARAESEKVNREREELFEQLEQADEEMIGSVEKLVSLIKQGAPVMLDARLVAYQNYLASGEEVLKRFPQRSWKPWYIRGLIYGYILGDKEKATESLERARVLAPHSERIKWAIKEVEGKSCFIATAVYRSSEHPDVRYLRDFRDRVMLRSFFGREFVRCYYVVGPQLARLLERLPILRPLARSLLRSIIQRLQHRKW